MMLQNCKGFLDDREFDGVLSIVVGQLQDCYVLFYYVKFFRFICFKVCWIQYVLIEIVLCIIR